MMTTANSTTHDDLLLAVRYVLNECDPSCDPSCDPTELAAFEARLGDDPMAQTALVEAVQIVALLQATPTCEALALESSHQAASATRQPARPVRAIPTPRSWQVVALVAASLLASVTAFWPSPPPPQDNHTATVVMTTESPALAQAWTALDPHHITSDESDPIDDAPVELASDVPDWLLTAVLVEAEQGASDENDQDIETESQL